MKADEPHNGQRHKNVEGNGNITALSFSLKGLEILYQERRGQVKTIVMEHFNGILFQKSGPANKQHSNQSINQGENCYEIVESYKTFHNAPLVGPIGSLFDY